MLGCQIPRRDLALRLLSHAREGPPFLISGPMGAGKSTLLRELKDRLSAEGWSLVWLELLAVASSPDRLVRAFLDALPTGAQAEPQVEAIRRMLAEGRGQEAAAAEALFDFLGGLTEVDGGPVALLLDEATEIRSLVYYPGLRFAERDFGKALSRRPRGTVLTTSFPTLAKTHWAFEAISVPALTAADLRPAIEASGMSVDSDALARASFGWPRYLRVLLERLATGADLVTAWTEELADGGRLDAACRHSYESLLLRSRGYGMSKAVLAAVAEDEGLNLTALVSRIRRSPGAVRDYLQWLIAVDALKMAGKRYYYVDGLLRLWVRLHARGTPPTASDIRGLAVELGLPFAE